MNDVERIARGLTEPQRKMLLRHVPGEIFPGTHWRLTSAEDPLSWNLCGRKLLENRLIEWASNQGEDTILLTLGIAVRNYLMEQSYD